MTMNRRHLVEDDELPLTLREGLFTDIQNLYWVAAYRAENEMARPDSWVFSPTKQPRQMANPHMYWRHPVYEEAVERQRRFDKDFDQMIKQVGERFENMPRRRLGVRTTLDDLEN